MSKAFGEEMSQVSASTKSLGEPESQMSTDDKSSTEEKILVHTTHTSPGEPVSHASTTKECPEEEKSQAAVTIKCFAGGEPDVNAPVKALGKPESKMGIPDNPDDLQSQAITADMSSDEEEPRASNRDESSGEEEPRGSNRDESSGKEEPHVSNTDESPDEEMSQTIAIDKPFGEEKPQVNVADNSLGVPEPQTGTTDESGEKEPQVVATNNPLANEKSQVNIADKPASQTSTTGKSGEHESSACATVQSTGEPELQKSNIDKSPSIQESQKSTPANQESEKFGTDGLRQRQFQADAHRKSPTDELEFRMDPKGTIELQSQESATESFREKKSQVHDTDQASGTSTKDRSAGEPESQGSITGKSPSKAEAQRSTTANQEFEKFGTVEARQRHLSTKSNDLESQTGKLTTRYHWLIGGFIVAALAVALVHTLLSSKEKPPVDHEPVLQMFLKEFANLKKDFPGQYEGLWFRSEKLLQMHLNMSNPSAPLILMLTAAQDGERTLHCVSKRLAKSYADSLRAGWLTVHGPSKSEHDSATSKMQIDDELSSGFQSMSRAAVLYRMEMLPPGSLLILYKYCDHENAAFKKVALVLTVLLEEQSLQTNLSFTEVEEKVKDLLWARFASSEVSAHNEMDVDKLSGVWSRISHIVLPVLPVGSIESGGCPGIQD